MIFQEGEKVFWNDPEDGISSGVYEIISKVDDDYDSVLIRNEHSEAEVFISELMKLEDTYVCNECGSFDIEELGWYAVNTRNMKFTDVGPGEEYWCNSCQEKHYGSPKSGKEYHS